MYLGDVETNDIGSTHRYFTGRFNKDVFIVAPGSGPAPTPHGVKDDGTNPAFDPIHTYHIGLWFRDRRRRPQERCDLPHGPTPFNAPSKHGGTRISAR